MKGYLKIFFLLLIPGLSSPVSAQDQPKLVVVLVVDQMRQDFLDRFGAHFDGGFARLMKEGVTYSNAYHDFVPTNTAPGHVALATGRYPSGTGIINNSFYDKDQHKEIYCVEDERVQIIGVENDGQLPGRSPRNITSSGLADWFKKGYKNGRVFSVSRKDRAAVIMGGQRPDGAYWFDNLSGQMVTSTYYAKKVPDWVAGFSATDRLQDVFEHGWNKFASDDVYASLRDDNFMFENGLFYPDFPHTMDRMSRGVPESQRKAGMMIATPMSDRFILDFSQELVSQENLGGGSEPDLLLVSCSAADAIGHHFGPESHEVMDHFLYLDQYLGEFFAFLDERVGQDKYWVVLSSDHGAMPMPEAMRESGIADAKRVYTSYFSELIDEMETELQAEYGLESIIFESLLGGVYVNFLEMDAIGVSRKKVLDDIATRLRNLDFIEDAFTSIELDGKADRPYADVLRRGYTSGKSPDIVMIRKENVLIHTQTGTGHGSLHDYDTHVPIMIRIPGVAQAAIDKRVSTVDIAPTIAQLLEIKADKKVDGSILTGF